MKAAVLVRNGDPATAFEIREVPKPKVLEGQVLIRVEAFGLNFADVMARLKLYNECPPLPVIIGYDVVGVVEETGEGVLNVAAGDRVIALTRFGGYAEYALTDHRGVARIPESMDPGKATALSTQYSTAYYCAEDMGTLYPEDHVLIHAAAGGVGTALIQLCKRHGCTVYGTAGSEEKLEYLRKQGVDHPINYRTEDFVEVVRSLRGKAGLDVIFDPIGGDYVKKGIRLLGSGGRIYLYGSAQRTTKNKNFFKTLKFALGFGFYNPVSFILRSKSLIGVNMLKLADYRPEVVKRCMEEVVKLAEAGELDPVVGAVYSIDELGKAHEFLESRRSTGKIVVKW